MNPASAQPTTAPSRVTLVDSDRGLGTAYERWHFYRLLDRWAAEYGATTALEGPVDGMAGVSGVHLAGLARRGVRTVAALATGEQAGVARAVYQESLAQEAAGASRTALASTPDVRVVTDPMSAAENLPPSDLVVAYHALSLVDDWRAYLQVLARLAKKALVVTVCNPDNWGVTAIRWAARLRGAVGMEAPAEWRTDVLAPELWKLGRVREHVYFDAPWWPDLQVAPGQSLVDRTRQLVQRRRGPLQFTAEATGAKLADRFVYGPSRWPYFEGPGWRDELAPALERHLSFEGAPANIARRVAHLHAFVVDMRPRTPQARRRLALAS